MSANKSDAPSLPKRLMPFVGRQNDLEKLADLLRDPSIRLVTILGSGGIGKTRLALELAGRLQDSFPDGIFFVPLAHIHAGPDFLPALAERFGIQLPPGTDIRKAILEQTAGRQAMLVLDNFEPFLEEAILVGEILDAGAGLKVLVTSREKLRLEQETLYRLEGLELPPADRIDVAEDFESVQLFLQKAKQARPGFALTVGNAGAVNRICRLVDGSPLGILLAAARVEHFSPDEIIDQACCNLDFLARNMRDTEPRHSSLRAVFGSSMQSLDERQKTVFRRLACFRGGFDLPAAQSVAGADLQTLIFLVDKCLLSRDPGTGRYELHELLRQYASEELDAAQERQAVQSAHSRYYVSFVEQREKRLISPDQAPALDEIQADFDNIRQACLQAIEARDFAAVRDVLPGLYAFCDMRSRLYEGEAIFHAARDGLAPRESEAPHPVWALALLSWYDMRAYNRQFETFEEIATLAEQCLEQAQSIQDPQEIAASLVLQGAIDEDRQEFEAAIRKYKMAMQAHPLLDDVYWVNMRIGLCQLAAKKYDPAIQAFQACLARGRETGERVKMGWALVNTGDVLLFQDKPAEALDELTKAREHFLAAGTTFGLLWSHISLGKAAIALGEYDRAQEHAEIADGIARQSHSASWLSRVDALRRQIAGERPAAAAEAKPDGNGFSQRELEILHMLQSDLSGPEIASRLVVSLNTVRFHTKNIYRKLGVNTRLEAIRRAGELGL